MTKNEARQLLENVGFNVLEQRGFYSHFLRVRKADAITTIETIDIDDDDKVPPKAASRIIRQWQP